jgi:DNA processing protein
LPIAVVGTRKNTSIGEKITIRTIEEFAKYNYSVVSGLALGIDTIAHRSAINSNIPTIAVLVDIENVAPKENQDLANEILKKEGLLVSENPPGTKIIPAFFAKRDRIQAGLSAGVFAIETAIDGGTMHAVNTAILMSRPVFVPNANAAGYPDLGIKAIAGTQQLVNDSKAEAYTRESYKEIRDQLEKIYTKFESNVAREMSL